MKRELKKILGAALVAAVFLIGMALPACAAPAQKNLILATTTSTQDSGLLDVLIPAFEKKTGYFVKTLFHLGEGRGSGRVRSLGSSPHLVPRSKFGLLPVNGNLKNLVIVTAV